MYKYIIKRILMMIPVIIGVSLLVFLVLKMTPGDPARQAAKEGIKTQGGDKVALAPA